MAVDVAGYSRLIGVDEEGTLSVLRSHRRELIDDLIEEHGGRIAKPPLSMPSACAVLAAVLMRALIDILRSVNLVSIPS